MAVGLTVKKEKFEEFKKEFEQIATKSNVSEIIPVINIDAVSYTHLDVYKRQIYNSFNSIFFI